jgi:hypothetical protein
VKLCVSCPSCGKDLSFTIAMLQHLMTSRPCRDQLSYTTVGKASFSDRSATGISTAFIAFYTLKKLRLLRPGSVSDQKGLDPDPQNCCRDKIRSQWAKQVFTWDVTSLQRQNSYTTVGWQLFVDQKKFVTSLVEVKHLF